MSDFGLESTIRQVLDRRGDDGRRLLYEHGYEVGEGFVDILSQYQSLRDAARAGRLRDVEGLIEALNRPPAASAPSAPAPSGRYAAEAAGG